MSFFFFTLTVYLILCRSELEAKITLHPPWKQAFEYEDQKYSVKCEGSEGKKWTGPNGSVIRGKSSMVHTVQKSGESGLYLIFENIQKEEKGEYTCSDSTDKESESFTLIVIKPAVFDEPTTHIEVKEGENLILTCIVFAEPKPDISWFFKDELITGFQHSDSLNNKYHLNLTNITWKDSGTYICRAFQSILQTRNAQKSFHVKVLHKPVLLPDKKTHSAVYGFHGENASLICQVFAEPVVYFIWYRYNQPIDPKIHQVTMENTDNMSILQISSINKKYYGDYQCEATNHLGKLIQYFVLNETIRPEKPETVISEVFDKNVIVSIVSHSHELYYKVEYTEYIHCSYEEKWNKAATMEFPKKNPEVQKTRCNITDLRPNTKYVLRVASGNEGGFGEFSTELLFRTRKFSSNLAVTLYSAFTSIKIFIFFTTICIIV